MFVEIDAQIRRAASDIVAIDGGGEGACFIFLRTLLAAMPSRRAGLIRAQATRKPQSSSQA